MADVENLFREYVEAYRAEGGADPMAFLDRVEGADRSELAALIDAYLARSPGRAWDSAAFTGSRAEHARDQIVAGWELEDGEELQGWRELLPALRNRAQVMRRDLVERLASEIGQPTETERVGAYYHQMELGQLPAEGVSNRVLSVLGEILGESADRLRAAGSVVTEGGASQAEAMRQAAFARTAVNDPRYGEGMASPADAPAAAGEELVEHSLADSIAEPDWNDVDRLFTGGPSAD